MTDYKLIQPMIQYLHSSISLFLSLLFLFFFQLGLVKGQAGQAMTAADSIHINKWGFRASQLMQSNPDSAILLVDKALHLARKCNHQKYEVKILRLKGLVYLEHKKIEKALQYCKESLSLAESTKFMISEVAQSVGWIYTLQERFDLVMPYYLLSHTAAIEANDTARQIDALWNLANTYSHLGQYDEAKSNYFECLELQRTSNLITAEIEVLQDLGWTYFQNNEIIEGLAFFEQGIKRAHDTENFIKIPILYIRLAHEYYGKGLWPQCLETYQKVLEYQSYLKAGDQAEFNELQTAIQSNIDDAGEFLEFSRQCAQKAKEGNNQKNLAYHYGCIGSAYVELNQIDSAKYYFHRCLTLRRKGDLKRHFTLLPLIELARCHILSNKLDSAMVYLDEAYRIKGADAKNEDRAELLLTHGDFYRKSKDAKKAIKLYDSGLQLAQRYGLKNHMARVNHKLYNIYEDQGETELAFNHFKTYQHLQDSLFGAKETIRLAQLKSQYEFDKEKELLVQKNEAEHVLYELRLRRQRLWIGFVVCGLFLSLVSIYLVIKNRKNSLEKERMRGDIKSQQHQLEKQQREKLQAMDQFKSKLFTDIAHELRTPLSIIKGMNKKIKDHPEVWLDKGTNLVNKNTQALLDLANQILLLQSLDSEEVKLNFIQGNILHLLKNLFLSYEYHADNKGVYMRFESEHESLLMDYDAEKIRLIVYNLLSNAIKFTPSYGHVSMRVLQENKNVIIQISDTGIGIPKADQDKVFQRFFQTKNEYNPSGSGVGLALVKEVVNVLDGQIHVESEVNKGTLFTVQLPITNQAFPEDQGNDHGKVILATVKTSIEAELGLVHEPVEVASHPQVLIIEDNADMRLLIHACLSQDFQLYFAKDGQAGLALAFEKTPDLIISDVMMPGMDGIELCLQLKQDERTSHIPIILLTAKADQASKIDGLRTGADAYLCKPFDEVELVLRIDKLLELRNTLQKHYAGIVLHSEAGLSIVDDNLSDAFLKKVQDFIQINLENESFEVEDLSRHLYLSRSQVFRKVKALTGSSPIQLIRKIRLDHARRMLMTTDLSVSEIAFRVGFGSSSHFSNCFYKEYNERPSVIQKVHSLR